MWRGLKKKHTDSFRNHPSLRSSTRTVSSKGVYDTVFQCKSGEIFVLRLDLTRADPQVKLFGCDAEHPLIDSDMHVRIAYHDGKLLGAAVKETIHEMQVRPPKILAITDDEVLAMQPSSFHPQQTPAGPTNPTILAIPAPVDPPSVSSMTADSAFPRLEPRLSFKDQAQTFVFDDRNNHHHANYSTTTPSVISSEHHHVPLAHAVRIRDNASMSDPSSASLNTLEQY